MSGTTRGVKRVPTRGNARPAKSASNPRKRQQPGNGSLLPGVESEIAIPKQAVPSGVPEKITALEAAVKANPKQGEKDLIAALEAAFDAEDAGDNDVRLAEATKCAGAAVFVT
jgi:hypothetical protein